LKRLIVFGAMAACIVGLLIKAPAIGKVWFAGGFSLGLLAAQVTAALREWEGDRDSD